MEEVKQEEQTDEIVITPKKKDDDFKVNLEFKKIYLIIAGIVVLLGVLVLLAWKFDLYGKAYASFYKASVDVYITDKDSKLPLAAEVELVNKQNSKYNAKGTLDSSGKLHLTSLVKGSYHIYSTLLGYYGLNEDLSIAKGDNALTYVMTKVPPKQAKISGVIKDYVNEKVASGAKVTVGDKSIESDADGKYSISALNLEDYDVKVEKSGYNTYTSKITISELNQKIGDIGIVPAGKVVFSSNRDKGKSGIYTANYDGSDQKALIAHVGDYEDLSPLVSPDNKKVAFISGREGKKDANGNTINNLFVVGIDGKNLIKVSDLSSNYGFRWIDAYNKILWQSYDSSTALNHAYIYDVAAKSNASLGSDTENILTVTLNASENKLTYSVTPNGVNVTTSIYWTSIDNIQKNLILDGKIGKVSGSYGAKNVNILQFTDNEVSYQFTEWDGGQDKVKYYTYNVANSSEQQIDKFIYPTYDSSIKSPDGKLKAYISNRDGKSNVFYSNANGDNEIKLSSVDVAQWPLTWSLDSKMIFFNVNKTGVSALYIVSIDGGTAKKVVDVYSGGYGYGQ